MSDYNMTNNPKVSISKQINKISKFFLIHFLSNLFLDSYIIIRTNYFNEVCFKNEFCPIKCEFSTRIFLLFFYFLWRSIFELHIFYMIFFVNNRLKRSFLMNLLLLLVYFTLIPFWFLYISNFISSKLLFIYFDLFFLAIGFLIFLPLIYFVFKIPLKLFWERNKFQLLFIITLLCYLMIGTSIANLQRFFAESMENGKNYFRIFVSTFCVLVETIINFVFSRLYLLFKKRNLINNNRYLFKILAQGLFGFTNTLQVGTILTSTFLDWGLYYQYIFMIYSTVNLMSKNSLAQKLLNKWLNNSSFKKIFKGKFFEHSSRSLEEPLIMFCSQKITSMFVFIPRLLFLLSTKKMCSPLTNISSQVCSTELPAEELTINIEPVLLFFILEVSIVIVSFFYFNLHKNKFMKKQLFQESFPFIKVFYYMSFHSVYEAWILLFIQTQKK